MEALYLKARNKRSYHGDQSCPPWETMKIPPGETKISGTALRSMPRVSPAVQGKGPAKGEAPAQGPLAGMITDPAMPSSALMRVVLKPDCTVPRAMLFQFTSQGSVLTAGGAFSLR
jgi:hypothetical protein